MTSSSICRLCLDVSPIAYSIFTRKLNEQIEFLTALEVVEGDNLPDTCCSKCIINVYFSCNFKNSIIESDKKLRLLLERDGNFNELLDNTSAENAKNVDYDVPEPVIIKQEGVECNISDCLIDDENTPDAGHIDENELDIDTTNYINIPLKLSCDVEYGIPFNELGDEVSEHDFIFRKTDTKPYIYHCKVCKLDIEGTRLFHLHKGKHMKKTCTICGITTRKDNFKKHLQMHTSGPQVCEICGSLHKGPEGLRSHIFHFHSNKQLYKCDICEEAFKYSHRLSHHKRKHHTGYRPHQCDSCGKGFFDLATMKKHVNLVHLKLRNHLCKYCRKGFSSAYALKVHTRQHTDETPYVCQICSEGFRQSVSLRTHLKSKHGVIVTTDKKYCGSKIPYPKHESSSETQLEEDEDDSKLFPITDHLEMSKIEVEIVDDTSFAFE